MKVKSPKNDLVKKVAIISSVFLLFVLVAIGVFYTAYNYGVGSAYSEYTNSASKYLADIVKLNNSTSTLVKDNKIDVAKTTPALNKIIDSLKKDVNSIDELIATDNQIKDKQQLLSGVNSNISLYQQIVTMLNTKDSSDAAQALTNLKQSRDACMNAYALLGSNVMDKSTTFINSAISYLYDLNKIQQTQNAVKSQSDDYIISIDSTVKKYLDLKTNYDSLLQNVRSNKGSYDDVLNTLSKNTKSLQDLFKTFKDMKNMPTNYKDSYTALNTVFDDYTAYLQNLTFVISTEKAKASASPITPDVVNQLYSTATTQLAAVENDYNTFTSKYSTYKTSVSR